jgi:hypothetical protein
LSHAAFDANRRSSHGNVPFFRESPGGEQQQL